MVDNSSLLKTSEALAKMSAYLHFTTYEKDHCFVHKPEITRHKYKKSLFWTKFTGK